MNYKGPPFVELARLSLVASDATTSRLHSYVSRIIDRDRNYVTRWWPRLLDALRNRTKRDAVRGEVWFSGNGMYTRISKVMLHVTCERLVCRDVTSNFTSSRMSRTFKERISYSNRFLRLRFQCTASACTANNVSPWPPVAKCVTLLVHEESGPKGVLLYEMPV